MSVISLRLPADAVDFLEQEGIAPGPWAKRLVLREVRRLRLRQARSRLDAVTRKPSRPSLELLREARDEH